MVNKCFNGLVYSQFSLFKPTAFFPIFKEYLCFDMGKDTNILSYERHAEHEASLGIASCFSSPRSIDAWRHNRMIETLRPLLKHFPGRSFLTVGDGKYGADAYLLKKHNVSVLASSLTDDYLKIAKENGYIDNYQVVNAENIPFEDNSFDFVFCKASYHHFPRPPIAFYEMIRVARIGVILIEPTDDRFGLLEYLKRPLKKLIRKEKRMDYEDSGNYVFRVNSRELKKMLTAMDKPMMGIRYFNDFYLSSVAGHESSLRSPAFILTKFAIGIQNILSFFRLLKYCQVTLIAFKTAIGDEVKKDMRRFGYKLTVLPKNPYL
jgi:ubiquinone/menaquinone biosynthesis C-methylase UbiE